MGCGPGNAPGGAFGHWTVDGTIPTGRTGHLAVSPLLIANMTLSNFSFRRFLPLCGVAVVVLASVGCPPAVDETEPDMGTEPVSVDTGVGMGDNTTVGGAMGDNTTVVTEVPAE